MCGSNDKNNAIICLDPDYTGCEKYVPTGFLCLRGNDELCISIWFILIAIFVSDLWQLIFESATLYAIEMTYKPTSLERMRDSEKYKDDELNDQTNPNQRKDPECSKIARKCSGEMLAIICYLISLSILIIFSIYSAKFGDINAALIQFAFAFFINQIKSILVQPVIWYVFIR